MNKETSSWKNWFTGFTDGEGSFCISFTLRKKMKLGIEVRPSFSIAQHKTSLACLELILSNFNCGGIRFNKIDQTYKYEIRNIKDLNDIIIPHFEKYGLLTIKQKDFLKFKRICQMIYHDSSHLNRDGLIEIINLAYSMNSSGKRKYSKDYLLKQIPKSEF